MHAAVLFAHSTHIGSSGSSHQHKHSSLSCHERRDDQSPKRNKAESNRGQSMRLYHAIDVRILTSPTSTSCLPSKDIRSLPVFVSTVVNSIFNVCHINHIDVIVTPHRVYSCCSSGDNFIVSACTGYVE